MSKLSCFFALAGWMLISNVARGEMGQIRQSSNRRQSVGQLVAMPPWAVLLRRTSKCTLDHSLLWCLHTTICWRFGGEARWFGLSGGFSSRLGILVSVFDIHTVIFNYRSNILKAYNIIIAVRLPFKYFKTYMLHDATVPGSSNANACTFQIFPLLCQDTGQIFPLAVEERVQAFQNPSTRVPIPFCIANATKSSPTQISNSPIPTLL